MRPTTLYSACLYAAIGLLVIMRLAGLLSAGWFSTLLFLAVGAGFGVMTAYARDWEETVHFARGADVRIAIRHAVRCPRCGTAAMLAGELPAEPRLPPGWQVVDGQPVCDQCLDAAS